MSDSRKTKKAPQVPDLKIKEGKFYRTRSGRKVGPVYRRRTDGNFPFTGGGMVFTSTGHWSADGECPLDLVAEWTDEPAPEAISPAPEPGGPSPQPDPVEVSVVQSPSTDPGMVNADSYDGQSWEVAVRCGYEPLAEVLIEALDQSQAGKGKERHARGATPFVDQPILSIARMTGVGGPAFQAIKKVQEACGMMERGEHDRAVRELLGAIVYTAATVIAVREDEARHS